MTSNPKPELPATIGEQPSQISLTYPEWCANFRPIKNELCRGAPFDGFMFETYGGEVDFVRRQGPENIWTLVDADDELIILSGWHIVNRLGYFVTERPWNKSGSAEVMLD